MVFDRGPGDHKLFRDLLVRQSPDQETQNFALTLGPVVTTPDEQVPPGVDWERIVAYAAENTRLYPGDVIAA